MIADLFIKRPKFAIVIAILMMLAGGICLNQLPIAEYPEIAPTSINVQATYTGASAQVVMETLASPIEEELNGLENLLYFSSKSDNTGGYSLSLTFKSGTNFGHQHGERSERLETGGIQTSQGGDGPGHQDQETLL